MCVCVCVFVCVRVCVCGCVCVNSSTINHTPIVIQGDALEEWRLQYTKVRLCIGCVYLQYVVLGIFLGGGANTLGLLAQCQADERFGSQVSLELELVALCLLLATGCLH